MARVGIVSVRLLPMWLTSMSTSAMRELSTASVASAESLTMYARWSLSDSPYSRKTAFVKHPPYDRMQNPTSGKRSLFASLLSVEGPLYYRLYVQPPSGCSQRVENLPMD